MTTRALRNYGIGTAAVIAVVVAWFASERVVRAPEGISERYVLRVGPLMLAGVEDTTEDTVVLWYDLDAGPDLKHIERRDNGDWVAVFQPRK